MPRVSLAQARTRIFGFEVQSPAALGLQHAADCPSCRHGGTASDPRFCTYELPPPPPTFTGVDWATGEDRSIPASLSISDREPDGSAQNSRARWIAIGMVVVGAAVAFPWLLLLAVWQWNPGIAIALGKIAAALALGYTLLRLVWR